MTRKISPERKTIYYVGLGLMVIGGLMFASTFLSAIMHFGDFTDFEARGRSMGLRAFGGMALLVLGGIVSGIGARGLAGSGVVLDPEKARGELEPYSRMAGGMVKDALGEAGIKIGAGEPEKIIMVKCQACGKLNGEDAQFCQECGKRI